MHHCYRTVLELIENHGLRMMKVDIHKQLRDLALRRNDLAEYVKHNDAVVAVTAETKGNAVAVKIAMQETERRLAEERQVHEKQLAVLHATLPKHVADRVARGETVSDHFDNAAVLFTDIAGFTTHSDVLPSYQVTALLENLFNAVAIARTALDFHQTGTSWPSGEPLTIRIGLHCGPVTAGVIGTERLQYDVWGDTVNVASRMESNASPGTVNVSADMARVLQDNADFTLVSRGMIEAKGKGAMEMFGLTRV